jgi:hypothetical protein
VTRRLVFRPEAETEIVAATDWYESRSAGLAAEFIRAVDAVLAGIQRNPLQ